MCPSLKNDLLYLYRHVRPDKNEPFYIGIGLKGRAYEKSNRNKYWRNIVRKNKGEYDIEILLSGLSLEEAREKEAEFIKLYGRKDMGKNSMVVKTGEFSGMKVKLKDL